MRCFTHASRPRRHSSARKFARERTNERAAPYARPPTARTPPRTRAPTSLESSRRVHTTTVDVTHDVNLFHRRLGHRESVHLARVARSAQTTDRVSSRVVRVDAGTTSIQFVKGQNETSVPEVRLTRSKDGTNGTAFFIFAEPDVFENGQGDITGMFLNDEEGEMSTVDVNAKFINGKPSGIEARYVMKTESEWNRFMRFMERYAEDNGLGFSKK